VPPQGLAAWPANRHGTQPDWCPQASATMGQGGDLNQPIGGDVPRRRPDSAEPMAIGIQGLGSDFPASSARLAPARRRARPQDRRDSLHYLDGEPGELIGGDVLGGAGGLARDEPDVIAAHDIDHGAADALCAGIALVALLGGAEEKRAVLVDPDVAWPLLPKAQLTGPSACGRRTGPVFARPSGCGFSATMW
jgi:hypothetical protein